MPGAGAGEAGAAGAITISAAKVFGKFAAGSAGAVGIELTATGATAIGATATGTSAIGATATGGVAGVNATVSFTTWTGTVADTGTTADTSVAVETAADAAAADAAAADAAAADAATVAVSADARLTAGAALTVATPADSADTASVGATELKLVSRGISEFAAIMAVAASAWLVNAVWLLSPPPPHAVSRIAADAQLAKWRNCRFRLSFAIIV